MEQSQKRMLEDRGTLSREDGDLLREYQAMHEENFLGSWLREVVEGKEEEREKMNKEAREEEKKVGIERWREKGKGLGLAAKESVRIVCLAKFSRFSGVGNTLDFSVCVPVVSPFVPVETLFPSNVNVVCDAVFSDSDCELVEPQTFSFSRTRMALECETETHIEGPLVEAVPESVRRGPTPQSWRRWSWTSCTRSSWRCRAVRPPVCGHAKVSRAHPLREGEEEEEEEEEKEDDAVSGQLLFLTSLCFLSLSLP